MARVIAPSDRTYIFEAKDAETLENALVMLGVRTRYNLRASRAEMTQGFESDDWEEMTDRSTADLRRTIAQRYSYQTERGERPLHYGRESWQLWLDSILYRREVDPVKEWLRRLPEWDGEPRAEELLRVAFTIDRERTPEAIERWASRYLTLGAVWRTFRPGVKQDEMPVIVGPQGIGKSTVLQWLLPAEHRADWFSDGLHLAAAPQERAEALQGRLIVEVGEMAGSTRAELESLKAFLSRTDDGMVRLAYRRNPETMLRRCIIVGTANEAALPNDPTGNRRFVAVHVTGGDVARMRAYLDEHRTQVWAEAVHLYHCGAEAWLPRELASMQAETNEHARRADELIEDRVNAWASDREGFTLAAAVAGCGLAPDEDAAGKASRRDQLRVSAALRLMGYEKRRERSGDGLRRVWRRAA